MALAKQTMNMLAVPTKVGNEPKGLKMSNHCQWLNDTSTVTHFAGFPTEFGRVTCCRYCYQKGVLPTASCKWLPASPKGNSSNWKCQKKAVRLQFKSRLRKSNRFCQLQAPSKFWANCQSNCPHFSLEAAQQVCRIHPASRLFCSGLLRSHVNKPQNTHLQPSTLEWWLKYQPWQNWSFWNCSQLGSHPEAKALNSGESIQDLRTCGWKHPMPPIIVNCDVLRVTG